MAWYRWAVGHYADITFIAKTDDDAYVHTPKLELNMRPFAPGTLALTQTLALTPILTLTLTLTLTRALTLTRTPGLHWLDVMGHLHQADLRAVCQADGLGLG